VQTPYQETHDPAQRSRISDVAGAAQSAGELKAALPAAPVPERCSTLIGVLPFPALSLPHVQFPPAINCSANAISYRFAVPMIGGMVSSTVLTLIVIPAIYAAVKGAWLPKARQHPPAQTAAALEPIGETQ
jgi:hypothetical protein